jgi:hypothetical protein
MGRLVEMKLSHWILNAKEHAAEHKKMLIDENKKLMDIAAIDAYMDSKNEAELEETQKNNQLSLYEDEELK